MALPHLHDTLIAEIIPSHTLDQTNLPSAHHFETPGRAGHYIVLLVG